MIRITTIITHILIKKFKFNIQNYIQHTYESDLPLFQKNNK